MWDIGTLTLVTGAFFLAGVVKGAIGVAFVVVVLSLLAVTVGLKEAIVLLVVPGIVTNVWQAFAGDAFAEIFKRIWPLLLTTAIGIWFGTRVLAIADTDLLILVLGCVLIAYSLISLRRPQIPGPGRAEPWMSPVMGSIGGFICGLTGSYIVPGVLYIQALGFKRDRLIQALGIVFLMISTVMGFSMWQHGMASLEIGLLSIAAVVPGMAGMILGQKIRARMPEERFRQAFFIAMILIGGYMIVRVLG